MQLGLVLLELLALVSQQELLALLALPVLVLDLLVWRELGLLELLGLGLGQLVWPEPGLLVWRGLDPLE